jgi:hypothetical protein
MSPTIHREGAYRFYFNSREELRPHVHVKSPDGEAKFWLEPVIALEYTYRIGAVELHKIEQIIREHEDEFKRYWNEYFS